MSFWDKAKDVATGVGVGTVVGGPLGAQVGGAMGAAGVSPGEAYDWAKKQLTPQSQYGQIDPGGYIQGNAHAAQDFAGTGTRNYNKLSLEARDQREMLRRQATGQDSYSAEGLRQGLQQGLAAQQAAAASARPANAAMAARTAAMTGGRMSAGLSGQQALAGIQERQAAQQALGQAILGARQQDMGVAQGSRGQALQGYGMLESARGQRYAADMGVQPFGQTLLATGGELLGAAAASDRRLKTGIKDGDADADEFLKGLKAYKFSYKDAKHGKGEQLGIMAQDLERSGLGRQAVIDTPGGKMVHGAKLATALAAATSTLDRRLSKLEGK